MRLFQVKVVHFITWKMYTCIFYVYNMNDDDENNVAYFFLLFSILDIILFRSCTRVYTVSFSLFLFFSSTLYPHNILVFRLFFFTFILFGNQRACELSLGISSILFSSLFLLLLLSLFFSILLAGFSSLLC